MASLGVESMPHFLMPVLRKKAETKRIKSGLHCSTDEVLLNFQTQKTTQEKVIVELKAFCYHYHLCSKYGNLHSWMTQSTQ